MENEKQRERLVELLDNLPNGELRTKDVADYLLANNVVVLPCNVGDTVYYINEYYDIYLHKDTIYEAKVARMVITKNNEISLVIV